MKNEIYQVIEDFNELCDYKILSQEDRNLLIEDLQLEEQFNVSVMEWLEKIYVYYTDELRDRSGVSFDFGTFDYEFLVYYYKTLLDVVKTIEIERGVISK